MCAYERYPSKLSNTYLCYCNTHTATSNYDSFCVIRLLSLLAHLAAPLAGDGIKFHSVGDGTHASQYFVDIGITEAGRWIAQETSGHGTSGGQHLPGKK